MLLTAKKQGLLNKSHLNKVNIDTTVQEKAIAYPTDARLYYKMQVKLVKAAGKHGIALRQSYRALLCGCGANIRKLIAVFFLSFEIIAIIREKLLGYLQITGIMKLQSCQKLP